MIFLVVHDYSDTSNFSHHAFEKAEWHRCERTRVVREDNTGRYASGYHLDGTVDCAQALYDAHSPAPLLKFVSNINNDRQTEFGPTQRLRSISRRLIDTAIGSHGLSVMQSHALNYGCEFQSFQRCSWPSHATK